MCWECEVAFWKCKLEKFRGTSCLKTIDCVNLNTFTFLLRKDNVRFLQLYSWDQDQKEDRFRVSSVSRRKSVGLVSKALEMVLGWSVMLKGVKSRGLRQLELVHTTTNLRHSSTKNMEAWDEISQIEKKSAPHHIIVLPSRENRKELHNYVSKKSKVSLAFLMILNPMPSPKTWALYVW